MRNNNLYLFLIFTFVLANSTIAFAEEINITDADVIWNFTMDNATSVGHLDGEPGVLVVKYADTISYQPLENPIDVNHLVGEPGVLVVKYADTISYQQLANPTDVNHLIGDPGVMVVKYADTISYQPLANPTSVSRRELEISIDHPSNGDLILNSSVTVNGTAISPNEITSVTVNGIAASGTTSWSATVPLTTGINTITVEVITNTTYSDTESIKVFHYVEGNYIDTDGDGVIDDWDQENDTDSGFWVNSQGIGRMLGDFNDNGMLDSGDVTILMRKIAGLIP